jgi:CheY-like chemotaxis protein
LAEIQSSRSTSELPCIAVTAYHTSKLREEAIKAGFTAYFAKPIDATAFARRLEEIL